MARIIFMGSPDFAVHSLAMLHQSEHDIVAVYTQPPRPKNRGQRITYTAVHHYAIEHGLAVEHPAQLDIEALQILHAYKADIFIVIAYGLLLPKQALEVPLYGAINIHASLLPRWRGAAPIERAIIAGDTQSGVCIMRMNEYCDEGDIIAHSKITIQPDDTKQDVHDMLAQAGCLLLAQTLPFILDSTAIYTPQPTEGACYAKKIIKDETCLDFTCESARALYNKIRGFYPYPACYIMVGEGKRIKIYKASLSPEITLGAGQIWLDAGRIYIGALDGTLEILELQDEGKKRMNALDYMMMQHNLLSHL